MIRDETIPGEFVMEEASRDEPDRTTRWDLCPCCGQFSLMKIIPREEWGLALRKAFGISKEES